MKVLVCGGREFTDTAFIHAGLDRLHTQYHFDILIEGDARGVDRIAGEWARAKGIALVEFPAEAKASGKYVGRQADTATHERIIALRLGRNSIARTAKLAGCSQSQVKRVWAQHTRERSP